MKKLIALVAFLMVVLAGCTDPAPRKFAEINNFAPPQALTYGKVTESQIEFTWDAVPSAPRYRVWLADNKNMKNGKFQRSTGANTIELFTGLKNNTTYYARVRVITLDGQNLSPYGEKIAVKTQAPVPTPTDAPTEPVPAADGEVTKILAIWGENKSRKQVEAGMPFMVGLSKAMGYFTKWKATTHPSNPNYIDAFFGSNFGVAKNADAGSKGRFAKPTVFGQAIKNGATAKEYADYAPNNCAYKSGSNSYESRHVPWPHSSLKEERDLCKQFSVPYKSNFVKDAREGTFPNVGLVVPNDCNNAHDCSLRTADNWFKERWKVIEASKDWKSGKLLVIYMFDEDDKKSGNIVWVGAFHPSLKDKVVTASMNHNSLTRAYADVSNAPYLEGAKTAPDMLKALGLEAK